MGGGGAGPTAFPRECMVGEDRPAWGPVARGCAESGLLRRVDLPLWTTLMRGFSHTHTHTHTHTHSTWGDGADAEHGREVLEEPGAQAHVRASERHPHLHTTQARAIKRIPRYTSASEGGPLRDSGGSQLSPGEDECICSCAPSSGGVEKTPQYYRLCVTRGTHSMTHPQK